MTMDSRAETIFARTMHGAPTFELTKIIPEIIPVSIPLIYEHEANLMQQLPTFRSYLW